MWPRFRKGPVSSSCVSPGSGLQCQTKKGGSRCEDRRREVRLGNLSTNCLSRRILSESSASTVSQMSMDSVSIPPQFGNDSTEELAGTLPL